MKVTIMLIGYAYTVRYPGQCNNIRNIRPNNSQRSFIHSFNHFVQLAIKHVNSINNRTGQRLSCTRILLT